MPTDEALEQAREADLDLVEVAPNERPPVCRIMDFGKFKYQQKKRQHKRPHPSDQDQGDPRPPQDGRARHQGQGEPGPRVPRAQGQGDRHGHLPRPRDAHIEEGRKVLDQMITKLEDVGKIEHVSDDTMGRRITCTLAPKSAPPASGWGLVVRG